MADSSALDVELLMVGNKDFIKSKYFYPGKILGINCKGSRIMGRGNGRTQRKMLRLEGVETIKQKGMGRKVLNICNRNGTVAVNDIL